MNRKIKILSLLTAIIAACCLLPWIVLAQNSTNVPPAEYDALYTLYNSTNGIEWNWRVEESGIPWDFYVSDPNPCFDDWQGINCSCTTELCHVTSLKLNGHNLHGILDGSISNLTELQTLLLVDNRIFGTLPHSLGSFRNLSTIDLRENYFNGTIPDSLGNLQSLKLLNLTQNSFTGTLPENLFTIENISVISASYNTLIGSIPKEFFNLKKINVLELSGNYVNGTISNSIGQMPRLYSFRLDDNLLSGTLPKALGDLVELRKLDLGANFLYSTIPEELGNLMNIEELVIGGNFLDGSFPTTIAHLPNLTSIDISRNLLENSLPASLNTNLNLTIFYAYYNQFTGHLPSLAPLQSLRVVDFSYNLFSGSINKQIPVGYPNINYFSLSENMFTGYLNDYEWERLLFMALHNNMFEGPIPSSFAQSQVLIFFDIGTNLFSSTIPLSYGSVASLTYFAVNENLLEGTIPVSISGNVLINQLFLGKNFLTGTIPDFLGELRILVELDLSNNKLEGTVPKSLHNTSNLQILFLANNHFSGPLDGVVNATSQPYLTNIDVSHNTFTGTIPVDIFTIPTLASFAAVANCVHGTIPKEICQASNLSSLILDGVSTSPSCRTEIFPFTQFLDAFVLTETLHGTIPECIFSLPKMQSLHLSANDLTGTLPDDVVYSHRLKDLTIAHNRISGTIPYVLQTMNLTELDLSYNRLTGHLVDNFQKLPVNGSLYLEVNRLSGHIPSQLKDAENIKILNGNIFTCDLSRSSLPDNDPYTAIYVCGSDAIDRAVFAWCLCISLPFLLLIIYFSYNRFYKKTNQVFEFVSMFIQKWFAINSRLRAEEVTLVVNDYSLEKSEERYLKVDNSSVATLMRFLDFVLGKDAAVTVYIALILMPIYSTFSYNSNTYESEYGWEVSAVLLEGGYAATTMTVTFCLLLFVLVIYAVIMKERMENASDLLAKNTRPTTLQPSEAKDLRPWRKKSWDIFVLFFIGLMNVVVMIAVDCGYVYIVLNYQRNIVITTQIFMAIFRIFWNEAALWVLIPYFKLKLFSTSEAATHPRNSIEGDTPSPTPDQIMQSAYDQKDVQFLCLNTLINNILVPMAAIACVSSNCFRTALIKERSVTDNYLILQCAIYVVNYGLGVADCAEERITAKEISYDPQFMYSYQCASTMSINYFTVFIYIFIISGLILPSLKLLAKHFYQHLPGEHKLYPILTKYLPVVLKKPIAETEHSSFRLFQKEKFAVRLIAYLATIMTFGSIYPPLAIVGFISIVIVIYTEQYLLGATLSDADQQGYLWYRKQLMVDCKDILKLYLSSVWQILPFSCLIVGYLIFDTMGYSNGWKTGLAIALIMMFWPVVLLAIFRLRKLIIDRQHSVKAEPPTPQAVEESLEASLQYLGNDSALSSDYSELDTVANPMSEESKDDSVTVAFSNVSSSERESNSSQFSARTTIHQQVKGAKLTFKSSNVSALHGRDRSSGGPDFASPQERIFDSDFSL